MQSHALLGGGGGGAPTASFMPMGTAPLYSAPAVRPGTGTPITTNTAGGGLGAPVKPASTGSGGAFGDLWSMSLGAEASPRLGGGTGKSIKDLEKEKAMAGLWGNQKPAGARTGTSGVKAPTNAFGSMGGGGGALSSGGGDDDLLL